MKEWEYKTVYQTREFDGKNFLTGTLKARWEPDLINLDTYGRKGWELVEVIEVNEPIFLRGQVVSSTIELRYVFKRPVVYG